MPTELTVSLERCKVDSASMVEYTRLLRTSNLPNTNKFNIDINRERFLEGCTLVPSTIIIRGVHFVCERDLLMIASREQTDFVEPK